MSLEDLRKSGWIILDAITGSQAYGTAMPTSDVDKKGVYIQPLDSILGMGYIEQISDRKNDETYYEVRRFLELLGTANPTVLELLYIPNDCIIYKDPIFDIILEHKEKFVTRVCKYSFGGYAVDQIKKARGLNKRIVKKTLKVPRILDFCYIPNGQGSITVKKYLKNLELKQENCGLVAIKHMRYMYGLYHNLDVKYKGIVKDELKSNDISLSSVKKGEQPIAIMFFNKDGYSTYCREYKQQEEWIKNRNPARYADNMKHGKGYDLKNIAHCHRLLDTAIEIGEGKGIIVRRPNREELLAIRRGEMEYDALISSAEDKIKLMDSIYESSDLPKVSDKKFTNDLLVHIRKIRYSIV